MNGHKRVAGRRRRLDSTRHVVAGVVTFALVAAVSVAPAPAAVAAEAQVYSDSEAAPVSALQAADDPARYVSEVVLKDSETVPIELGETSAAGVLVPEELAEPITVDTTDGSLGFGLPVNVDVAPEVTSTGDVIAASSNAGAELIVQELDTDSLSFEAAGTRTLITIDSAEVDPLFVFKPEVPAGGSVAVDEATGGVIVSDAEGHTSSVLATPWAFDAAGSEVPTWFEIDGDKVIQYVDHLSRDFEYPVVADPVWVVPVLLFVGRIVLKEVISATLAAATAKAIKGVGTEAKYRSWTNANKRHNYIIYTKKDPGSRCDVHHTLPQKFEGYFRDRGFVGGDVIHHPRYLVWWELHDHRSKAVAVNKMWERWIADNRNASKTAILNERTYVLRQYPPRC